MGRLGFAAGGEGISDRRWAGPGGGMGQGGRGQVGRGDGPGGMGQGFSLPPLFLSFLFLLLFLFSVFSLLKMPKHFTKISAPHHN